MRKKRERERERERDREGARYDLRLLSSSVVVNTVEK